MKVRIWILLFITLTIVTSCAKNVDLWQTVHVNDGLNSIYFEEENNLCYTLRNVEYNKSYLYVLNLNEKYMKKDRVRINPDIDLYWNSFISTPPIRYYNSDVFLDVHHYYGPDYPDAPRMIFYFISSDKNIFEKAIEDSTAKWYYTRLYREKYSVIQNLLFYVESKILYCVDYVKTAKEGKLIVLWQNEVEMSDRNSYILSGNKDFISLMWDNKVCVYETKTGYEVIKDFGKDIIYANIENNMLNYIQENDNEYYLYQYDIKARIIVNEKELLIQLNKLKTNYPDDLIYKIEKGLIFYRKNMCISFYDISTDKEYNTNLELIVECEPLTTYLVGDKIIITVINGLNIYRKKSQDYIKIYSFIPDRKLRDDLSEELNGSILKKLFSRKNDLFYKTAPIINSIENGEYIVFQKAPLGYDKNSERTKSEIWIIKKSDLEKL